MNPNKGIQFKSVSYNSCVLLYNVCDLNAALVLGGGGGGGGGLSSYFNKL